MTVRQILLVLCIIIILVALVASGLGRTTIVRFGAPPTTAAPCLNGEVFTGCIFGLHDILYVIESQYQYEASILPSGQPVGDYDFMLPGIQEPVKLPGGKWDVYHFVGQICVVGSGWVVMFRGPDGGTFDLLHEQYTTINGHRSADCTAATDGSTGPPEVVNEDSSLGGDERTAAAAVAIMKAHPPTAVNVKLHGGDYVGLSRWPDYSIYGNGSFGPADAHQCLLLDEKARLWFFKVATGGDKKPKPAFPLKVWQARTHHISAYSHHTLTRAARTWWKARPALGPLVSRTFHGRVVTPFYEYRFTKAHLTIWPSRPKWAPHIVRNSHG